MPPLSQLSQTLRSFILNLPSAKIVLPYSSMIEVLPFATPLKLENVPSWVVGTLLWRSLNVPLIALDRLIHEVETEIDAYTRIVMINTLGDDPQLPYLGLLVTDAPRLTSLGRMDVILDKTAKSTVQTGVLSWVIVRQEPAIIPDISAIEQVLSTLLHHR